MAWSEEFESAWCRDTFRLLQVGGVWAVPRSGLLFRKEISPDRLVLQEAMPYQAGLPMTVEEFVEFQRDDLAVIREKFQTAGITVEGEVDALS